MKKIDGKKFSEEIRERLKKDTDILKSRDGIQPGLAVVLVGEDPASQVYVRNKTSACDQLGFYSQQHTMAETTTTNELITLINQLNNNDKIHGILVQLPLPSHINEKEIINSIHPSKDVDAFTMVSQGGIMTGDYSFLPCTPAGIIQLIKSTGVTIAGSDCVVVGRSNIVGKPLAMMLLAENGTVTVCHSKTKNIIEQCRRADILIAAVGVAGFIKKEHVKPGAVVIDVGINRGEDGKLCGDVDFDAVYDLAGYITPVPGGVGPMTITMLMENTYNAAKNLSL